MYAKNHFLFLLFCTLCEKKLLLLFQVIQYNIGSTVFIYIIFSLIIRPFLVSWTVSNEILKSHEFDKANVSDQSLTCTASETM